MALPTIKRDLAFINVHCSCLTDSLTAIQKKGVGLTDAIDGFLNVRAQFNGTDRAIVGVRNKFDAVIEKNTGFDVLRQISLMLRNSDASDSDSCDFIRELSPTELSAYATAPVTSCDVERTFSSSKYILSDQRRSFTIEHLKQHLVIYCNDL